MVFTETMGRQWFRIQGVHIKKKVKRKLKVLSKEFCLDLTIECNKTTVGYLDITLNLLDRKYKPYKKPENTLQYIDKGSNHPPNIIKQI